MTKAELLDLLRLLSAIEGWSFATKERFPEHLSEAIEEAVKKLSDEVLK